MAFFKHFCLLVLLLCLHSAAQDQDPPNWAPFNKQLCQEVECGKGKCVSNSSYPFNFICECDAGWKRTRLDKEDDLEFLPCVIPNCSVQYSCMPAPPPLPPAPYNLSFFNPCYYIYCGGGTCNKSTPYAHTCQCNAGYTNLMNVSVFPCFSDCAIGSDCSTLGIKVSSSTTSPTSNNTNHGNIDIPGSLILGSHVYVISCYIPKEHVEGDEEQTTPDDDVYQY